MRYLWCTLGVLLGLVGIYSWYLETYTDSSIAAFWRTLNGRNNKETSGSSLAPLLISIGFSLFAFTTLLSTPLTKGNVVLIPLFIIGIIGLTFIIIGFICFLPLPVPRWADARYQYMKRHNLLDENGDPLPQSQWPDSEITPADDPEETSL